MYDQLNVAREEQNREFKRGLPKNEKVKPKQETNQIDEVVVYGKKSYDKQKKAANIKKQSKK